MCAAQHHHVGAPAIAFAVNRHDFVAQLFHIHFVPAQFLLGNFCQTRSAVQKHFAVKRISVDERMGIFAVHCAWCGQHSDNAGFGQGGCGFDGRHRSNKWQLISFAQFFHRNRRGGVAGNHHHIGFDPGDQCAQHFDNALDQILFFPRAIGKARIVGRINQMRIGQLLCHRTGHGQAAHA